MTAIENEKSTVPEEFAEFERLHGRSFIWGRLVAPYDGCFYKNMPVLVRGERAFLFEDLRQLKGRGRWMDRARFVVEPPDDLDLEEFRAGCIRLEDLEEVLGSSRDLEFHPISELEQNTPYGLYRAMISMCEALELDLGDQFKCRFCEAKLDPDDLRYFESEYHGTGGIEIDVGQPICSECYYERSCGWCDADGLEPWQTEVYDEKEDQDRCIWCAPERYCQYCETKIDLGWTTTEEDLFFWSSMVCGDPECREKFGDEQKERELQEKRDAAMGNLFDPRDNPGSGGD